MSLRVTVLGSSGMFATVERACSGYLVEIGDYRLWLDAGAGTWRNLVRHIDYGSLDGVVLTHRHPDHTTDVFQAFHARQYGGAEPLEPVPLWAPSETLGRICAFGGEIDRSFDLRPVAAGETHDIGAATVSFCAMAHPAVTLGVRMGHDGAVFAYSADTGPAADFTALAGDADVFLCEATLQDSDPEWEGHLRASQAGEIAARSGAARLVLTHLPPDRDVGLSLAQARAACPDAGVELAADGQRLEVAR
jgi:ribonuclease BN (tRNA processing enzyme)